MKPFTKQTRNLPESSMRAARCSGDKLSQQYLIGQWPRELNQSQTSCMSDKSTQTPVLWTEEDGECSVYKHSASRSSSEHLTEITKLRQQLQHSLKGSRSISEIEESTQTSQTQPISASPSNTSHPRPSICRIPSYNECENQELENVFISDHWRKEKKMALEVRDGGRAPAPAAAQQVSHRPCSCCSPAADERDPRSTSPLPQFSCSPKPNNSFRFNRLPPEGCEKVKVYEELGSCSGVTVSCPDRNKIQFSPSGSAFCPV